MGARLSRAAQPRRAHEEGRRRPQRAGAHRDDLRQERVPLHRQSGSAFAVPLVGPVHAAPSRRAGRRDGECRAGGARRRVLHAAHPHRRRPIDVRAAARDRIRIRALRPRRRRRDRPAERPAALDPHRRHAADLRGDRASRADDGGGMRRHAAQHDRVSACRHRCRRDHRRDAVPRGDAQALRRRPRVQQSAAQV